MRRFYYDTVFYDQDMLHFLIKKVGVNQVMMGTDYPLSMTERDPCALIRGSRALSSEVKEKILWKNAAKLLNIGL